MQHRRDDYVRLVTSQKLLRKRWSDSPRFASKDGIFKSVKRVGAEGVRILNLVVLLLSLRFLYAEAFFR